jgi:hypothetical protein
LTGRIDPAEFYSSPEFREMVMASMNSESPEIKAFDDSAPELTEHQTERLALLLNTR